MTEHDWHIRAMRAEDRAEKAEAEVQSTRETLYLAVQLKLKAQDENEKLKAEVARLTVKIEELYQADLHSAHLLHDSMAEVARLQVALGRIAEAREDDHACDIADAALESVPDLAHT